MPVVTIDLSQNDIDYGLPGWCGNCPVARATNRVLDKCYYAHVTDCLMSVCEHGPRSFMHRSLLPVHVSAFIRDFDLGEPVTPFTFQLDIPAEFLREPCQT